MKRSPVKGLYLLLAVVMLLGMALAPATVGAAPVQPEGGVAAPSARVESALPAAAPDALGGAGSGIVAAGNWLVGQQLPNGGFSWTPGDTVAYGNIQGSIAGPLLDAYKHSGVVEFKTTATETGDLYITLPYLRAYTDGDPRFSTYDPVFLEQLSAVTGDPKYAAFVQANLWNKLAAGTYGEADDLDAAEWAQLIITNLGGNFEYAPWDIGGIAVAAQIAGETAIRDAVMGKILEVLNATTDPDDYDLLGLAGAVWAAGVTGKNLDPTTGVYAALDSTAGLAGELASHQYASGSWASGTTEPNPGDWQEAQTTAFALLGLKSVDPVAYKLNIARGAAFLRSLQQTDGEILSWVGAAPNVGGSTETHAEALSALSTAAASIVYVNASWSGTTAGADPDGTGPATAYGWDAFSTVGEGVDAVAPAGTVNVAAGTYSQALTLNKPLSLVGAGSGATVIGPQLTINGQASGVAGTPTLIKGVNISGGGNDVVLNDGLQYVRFEAIKVGNSGVTGGQGIWAVADADVAHLQFVNVEFYGNTIDLVFENTYQEKASTADDILVDGCVFSGTGKGIYAEKLSNAVIKNSTFTNVANGSHGYYGQAVDINLKWAAYANITIKANTFTDSGNSAGGGNVGGSAIGLKARGTGSDTGYATQPAAPTNVTITGNTFSGGQRGVRMGEPGKSNTGPTKVVINGNKFLNIPSTPTGTDAAGAVVNTTTAVVNALGNWWGDASGPGPVGPGTGAPVTANVLYNPWWTNAAMTTMTFPAGGGTYPGGLVINSNGAKINLNGATVGAGSPAFIINADDVEINGVGTLAGNHTDPAVLVLAGADNFALQGVEVKDWEDGVQVAGDVTSLKIVNNFIHNNDDAGLQVDGTVGGVQTVEGNLFKANGIDTIKSVSALNAQWNSFGVKNCPSYTNVDVTNCTFAETFIDVDRNTTGEQTEINVDETRSFDVSVLVDAKNLYGFAFKFNYDQTKLVKNSAQAVVPSGYACLTLPGLAANEIGYQCAPSTGNPVINGLVEVGVANFTATGSGLLGNGPWNAYFDVDPVGTTAGTANGALVYLNNVKLAGLPNVRDITETTPVADDGKVVIRGIANFTGFIDVQGRADDSGAVLKVFSSNALAGTELANATSAKGGAYTTVHTSGNILTMLTSYYFLVDKPLYVKTAVGASAPNKVLSARPLTVLGQLVLKGGDATNDENIGVDDATCIGGAYGAAPTVCGSEPTLGSSDVNGDGKVDILDLTLMGGNFGIAASTWTP